MRVLYNDKEIDVLGCSRDALNHPFCTEEYKRFCYLENCSVCLLRRLSPKEIKKPFSSFLIPHGFFILLFNEDSL